MRSINFNTVAFLGALIGAFLSGYFSRGPSSEPPRQYAQAEDSNRVLHGNELSKPRALESAGRNQVVQGAPIGKVKSYIGPATAFLNRAPSAAEQSISPLEKLSMAQLLERLASLSTQAKAPEEIRDTQEFQQFLSSLAGDQTARKNLLERFLKVSATPFGKVLSLALAMSAVGPEIPEIKTAAMELLQNGNAEQRLNALQLLEQSSTNEAGVRAVALDILRHNADANPQLAKAAMATVSQKTVVSQGEYQEVLGTVAPLLHSEDPQIRQASLALLSQWASRDPSAQQTILEAARDADPDVRSLAISTLGKVGFDFSRVRDTLLSTLQNPDEAPGVKIATQQALEAFALDEQALAIYQAHMANPANQAAQVGFN